MEGVASLPLYLTILLYMKHAYHIKKTKQKTSIWRYFLTKESITSLFKKNYFLTYLLKRNNKNFAHLKLEVPFYQCPIFKTFTKTHFQFQISLKMQESA